MANNSVIFDLILNDKSFQGSITDAQKLADKLKKSLDATKDPVSKLGSGFASIRSGVNGVFNSVFNLKNAIVGAVAAFGLGKLVQAASEGEQAVSLLAAAMKRSGEFSQGALSDMQAFSDTLLTIKGVGGDTVLSQLALAKSFGLSNDEAKKVVSAAVDMSTALGTDLKTSVTQLSEAYNGNAGKLSKLHPEIGKLSEEQLKAGAATKILAAQFDGAAHSLLNTFGGAVSKSGQQFQDLEQTIGGLITSSPAVVEFIQKMGDLFTIIGNKINANKAGIQEFLKNLVTGLVDAGPTLIRSLGFVAQGFQGVALGISSAVVFVADFYTTILSFDIVQPILTNVSRGFETIGYAVLYAAKGWALLGGASQETLDVLDGALDGIATAFNKAPETISSAVAKMKLSLAEAREDALNYTDKVDPKFEALKKSIEEVAQAAGKLKFGQLTKVDLTGGDSKKIDTGIIGQGKNDGKGRVDPETLKPLVQQESLFSLSVQAFAKGMDAIVSGIPDDFDGAIKTVADEFVRRMSDAGVEIGKSFATNILSGKEGARKVIVAASSALADAFLGPGAGQIVGPIVEGLSQGPAYVKQMVNEFADALPDLLQAITDSIPVFIQVLADRAPDIIVALVNAAPKIAYALIVALSNPQLYIRVAEALAGQVGQAIAYRMAVLNQNITDFQNNCHDAGVAFSNYIKTELPNSVKTALDTAAGAIKDSVKAAFTGLTDPFKDAAKAFIDGLLADVHKVADALTGKSGGNGVVADTVQNVADVVTGKKQVLPNVNVPGVSLGLTDRSALATSHPDNTVVMALLGHVVELLKQPMSVQTTATVDGRSFADIVLNLSRTNQRLRA